MKRTQPTRPAEARDFTFEEACILCGGDLEVRLTPGGARTYCRACRWISRPVVARGQDGMRVVHPAGLVA
jgi:hypothetical protein